MKLGIYSYAMVAENLLPITSLWCGYAKNSALAAPQQYRNTPPERADKVQKYSEPYQACFPWKNVQIS